MKVVYGNERQQFYAEVEPKNIELHGLDSVTLQLDVNIYASCQVDYVSFERKGRIRFLPLDSEVHVSNGDTLTFNVVLHLD